MYNLVDWLTDPPSGGRWQQWIVGVGLSLIPAAYGLGCIFTQHAYALPLRGRITRSFTHGFWREVHGAPAISIGILCLCIGLFMHFQWYWGNHKHLSQYYLVGKGLAATGAVVAFIAYIFTSFIYS